MAWCSGTSLYQTDKAYCGTIFCFVFCLLCMLDKLYFCVGDDDGHKFGCEAYKWQFSVARIFCLFDSTATCVSMLFTFTLRCSFIIDSRWMRKPQVNQLESGKQMIVALIAQRQCCQTGNSNRYITQYGLVTFSLILDPCTLASLKLLFFRYFYFSIFHFIWTENMKLNSSTCVYSWTCVPFWLLAFITLA